MTDRPKADPEYPELDFKIGSSLDQLQSSSINYRIAVSPHAGHKAAESS